MLQEFTRQVPKISPTQQTPETPNKRAKEGKSECSQLPKTDKRSDLPLEAGKRVNSTKSHMKDGKKRKNMDFMRKDGKKKKKMDLPKEYCKVMKNTNIQEKNGEKRRNTGPTVRIDRESLDTESRQETNRKNANASKNFTTMNNAKESTFH